MAKVSITPSETALQRYSLEALVFEWDGRMESARQLSDGLIAALPRHGAKLTKAALHAQTSQMPVLDFTVTRDSDGEAWVLRLVAGDRAVVWLDPGVRLVEELNGTHAETIFGAAPTITLRESQRSIEP